MKRIMSSLCLAHVALSHDIWCCYNEEVQHCFNPDEVDEDCWPDGTPFEEDCASSRERWRRCKAKAAKKEKSGWRERDKEAKRKREEEARKEAERWRAQWAKEQARKKKAKMKKANEGRARDKRLLEKANEVYTEKYWKAIEKARREREEREREEREREQDPVKKWRPIQLD